MPKPKRGSSSKRATSIRETHPSIRYLHKGALTLAGIFLVALVAFIVVNWDFVAKNLSFWWQTKITNSWQASEEEIVGEPDRVRIASLNIEAPLIYAEETNEAYFQEALALGVVHYPGTALPGQKGNAFYFGHSSDFAYKPGEYKTVFALLPQIKQGDTIEVTNSTGRQYTYEVVNTIVVGPNQTEVLSQGDRSEALLTLQTSYPVGTALKRFIVQAKLIS